MNMYLDRRKTRNDSVLEGLGTEQKKRLAHWLGEENRGYEEVRRLVAAEFRVTTSRSALSRYFRNRIQNPVAGRLNSAGGMEEAGVITAEDLAAWEALPAEAGQVIENAALARARQLAFHALTNREPDVKLATQMFAIVRSIERARIEQQRAELEARKLELKRAKRRVQEERVAVGEKEMPASQAKSEDERAAVRAVECVAPVAPCSGGNVAKGEALGGVIPRREDGRTEAESPGISRLFLDRAA